MRRYLLDTPMVSAYLLSRPTALTLVRPWIENGEVATSILVYGEVNEYIRGRNDYPQLHAQLVDLLKEIPPFFVTYPIMGSTPVNRGVAVGTDTGLTKDGPNGHPR